MLRLSFAVEGAKPSPSSATPSVLLALRVAGDPPDVPIHAVLLRCEVRIDAPRRSYEVAEQHRLHDLFGEPARWSRSLMPLVWTQATVMVPAFSGEARIDVPLPCGIDFDASLAKYFEALEAGGVPLSLLFSGTVFHARADGALQAAPLPWATEARFTLPVAIYREAYELHHPNRAILALPRDVLERLRRYKVARGAPTWGQAVDALLAAHERSEERA